MKCVPAFNSFVDDDTAFVAVIQPERHVLPDDFPKRS
jgi:hypothetical protein